jgi:hypothetical protein
LEPQIEEYYQSIGQQAMEIVGQESPKIMLYSELEDGAIDCGLFFREGSRVVYRDCPYELSMTIYRFWQDWRQRAGNVEWRVFVYTIENNRFDIDLVYPDQLDPKEWIDDRRPRAIIEHFDNLPVDYDAGA